MTNNNREWLCRRRKDEKRRRTLRGMRRRGRVVRGEKSFWGSWGGGRSKHKDGSAIARGREDGGISSFYCGSSSFSDCRPPRLQGLLLHPYESGKFRNVVEGYYSTCILFRRTLPEAVRTVPNIIRTGPRNARSGARSPRDSARSRFQSWIVILGLSEEVRAWHSRSVRARKKRPAEQARTVHLMSICLSFESQNFDWYVTALLLSITSPSLRLKSV